MYSETGYFWVKDVEDFRGSTQASGASIQSVGNQFPTLTPRGDGLGTRSAPVQLNSYDDWPEVGEGPRHLLRQEQERKLDNCLIWVSRECQGLSCHLHRRTTSSASAFSSAWDHLHGVCSPSHGLLPRM